MIDKKKGLASVAALHQAGETTCDRADLHGTHGRTRTDISRRRFNRQSYMGIYGPKFSGHAAGCCPALPAGREKKEGPIFMPPRCRATKRKPTSLLLYHTIFRNL